ncbi:hypothetical protein LEP1GSC188_1881 [Leptospira weilii serovar Topaz str. LT2116]|uniref:Uncharacterized protein n=1 Tax=Leptospira weilii serovar Topaz str. LT2116 TaxID=1088540 RepID=M3GWI9_9LEPT|nr:hypothetical protein LEP1GSC188_1881 [Leptospira weilii serovar Topaz str. LT2116]
MRFYSSKIKALENFSALFHSEILPIFFVKRLKFKGALGVKFANLLYTFGQFGHNLSAIKRVLREKT